MAGLVPAIHAFFLPVAKTWVPGTSPGMTGYWRTVGGRNWLLPL